MTLAKPINKYIDYIDAPEDTFEPVSYTHLTLPTTLSV